MNVKIKTKIQDLYRIKSNQGSSNQTYIRTTWIEFDIYRADRSSNLRIYTISISSTLSSLYVRIKRNIKMFQNYHQTATIEQGKYQSSYTCRPELLIAVICCRCLAAGTVSLLDTAAVIYVVSSIWGNIYMHLWIAQSSLCGRSERAG